MPWKTPQVARVERRRFACYPSAPALVVVVFCVFCVFCFLGVKRKVDHIGHRRADTGRTVVAVDVGACVDEHHHACAESFARGHMERCTGHTFLFEEVDKCFDARTSLDQHLGYSKVLTTDYKVLSGMPVLGLGRNISTPLQKNSYQTQVTPVRGEHEWGPVIVTTCAANTG